VFKTNAGGDGDSGGGGGGGSLPITGSPVALVGAIGGVVVVLGVVLMLVVRRKRAVFEAPKN
jgi:LPXTG-motif cell wall-anchored protein